MAHQEEAGGLIASTTRQRHSHEHGQEEDEEERTPHNQLETDTHSTFRVLTLVFALSLHAVFEGLSIGMISNAAVLLQVLGKFLVKKMHINFFRFSSLYSFINRVLNF